MKCLYIYYDLNTSKKEAVGILKKVYAQQKLFNEKIDEGCDLVNLTYIGSFTRVNRTIKYLFSKKTFDLSFLENKKYDYVYIRRINPNCKSLLEVFRLLKRNNPNCKIVYEVPTYPYDFEHKTFGTKITLIVDRIYRQKLHKYVDRIVTITDDEEIFGCETLKITNGVDVNSIPICKKNNFAPNHINLIAVAQFAFWHGYERVIEGLYNYYKNGGLCEVILNLVGNGPELQKYKKLVAEYSLEKNIIFHGALYGEQLNQIFDTIDIALCSLACHKKNIYIASELKSREYLCRGLPIVTSTKIDIIPDDFIYALHVPEDDSAIDIGAIVDFVRKIYEDAARESVVQKIRTFAEENCGMESAMKNVVEFFN